MSAALAGPFLEWRRDEDIAPAVVLALAMHVVLALALVFGVSWQSRAPEVVSVELWQPQPPPAVAPEPPKPAPVVEVKPEPRVEKPDIAIKEPEKPKPKPEAKPKPKPVAKPVPDESQARKLFAEALQREQQQLAAAQESQRVKDQMASAAANARFKAIATWVDKVRAKIRGNIILLSEVKGNPEALFLVTLLPNGDVLQVQLVISSGDTAYDEAVHRAIRKSSPLPKPDSGVPFERQLKLTFRPVD